MALRGEGVIAMIFDGLLRALGILPDIEDAQVRKDARLEDIRKVDEEQEKKIEEARRELQRTGTRDITEQQFMEELLQIKRRRNGEGG
jgi:hypothetical protein